MAAINERVTRLLGLPPVVTAGRVMARYGAVDGGLLAGGLAYAALTAIVPTILLTAGLLGLVVSDPARRDDAISLITAVLPPLHDLVTTTLTDAGQQAGALGILGAATLAWGASRFVLAFTGAVARVMGRSVRGGTVARNALAVAAVLLLPGAILAGAALAGVASFLGLAESQGVVAAIGLAINIALGFLPLVATIVVVALAYRIVPTPSPDWRAVTIPAIAVGIALTVLLQAFVFLAPRLIGAAALLGTLATVFAALAWLALSFQAILLGAAWVTEREAG